MTGFLPGGALRWAGDIFGRVEIVPADDFKPAILRMTRFTGWSLTEIKSLSIREFLWWLESVPRND